VDDGGEQKFRGAGAGCSGKQENGYEDDGNHLFYDLNMK
jgi:hypothetical protein